MPLDYSISISARGKASDERIAQFLNNFNVDLSHIDSIFGFVEKCALYGGRTFRAVEISENDYNWMLDKGIGFRIPLQSTQALKSDYETCKPFLEKYHRTGNTVIIAKDWIAKAIKRDFPLYSVEASVIKQIDSVEKLLKALKLYDSVVPDPWWFNNANSPDGIEQCLRERVRLFLNAGCMYTCPARICYPTASKANLGRGESRCSRVEGIDREYKGSVYEFSLQDYLARGYLKFKLLRSNGYRTY